MKVVHSSEIEAKPVSEEGARGATVRWLLARPEGAPSFAMRLFELAPGGQTPSHEHAWEHEVFVLDGDLEVVTASGCVALGAGDAVLTMPQERHQFRNTAEAAAHFLCLIPLPEES